LEELLWLNEELFKIGLIGEAENVVAVRGSKLLDALRYLSL